MNLVKEVEQVKKSSVQFKQLALLCDLDPVSFEPNDVVKSPVQDHLCISSSTLFVRSGTKS